MNNIIISSLLLMSMLSCSISDLSATEDLEREQTIAGKLVKRLNYGEVVWFDKDKTKFIGLFYEVYPYNRKDAAILLHGMGAHPDWPDVIAPLRDALPRRQIASLSIQLPILTSNTNIADYGKTLNRAGTRIRQAVEFLQSLGFQRIALIGFNFGATTAAYYLAADSQHGLDAFVAISVLARKFLRPELEIGKLLQGIHIPVLDIYAERDHAEILHGIADRRLAASISGNRQFSQIEIKKAQHDYTGYEYQLISEISKWINQMKTEEVSIVIEETPN